MTLPQKKDLCPGFLHGDKFRDPHGVRQGFPLKCRPINSQYQVVMSYRARSADRPARVKGLCVDGHPGDPSDCCAEQIR